MKSGRLNCNAGLMLGQRRRRWANITAFDECPLFSGVQVHVGVID